ncbi:hypothetical protein ASD07_13055 [Duganella sp. Root336D2]|nr:hypothetical protein ASD07_13055 [Duganella sp. Root336D2]
MLQVAAQQLAKTAKTVDFETEYAWENLIIRLSLYRNTVKTLTNLPSVAPDAEQALSRFDAEFTQGGKNALISLRNMFEHFDDYATGAGRGPAERNLDLDPWRSIAVEEFSRGQFKILLSPSMAAANYLRSDAEAVSDKFIRWYERETAR